MLYRNLHPVLDKLLFPYELIFVDDGSTDRTLEILLSLSEQNPHVRWLSFFPELWTSESIESRFGLCTG